MGSGAAVCSLSLLGAARLVGVLALTMSFAAPSGVAGDAHDRESVIGSRPAMAAGKSLRRGDPTIAPTQRDGVRIEYVAHAAFIIVSPAGTRIIVDPYNGNIWLGYSFPRGLEVDAVVVSHPHYDHDATYYFDNDTPVFRAPGEYRVGDIVLRGVASEHFGAPSFRDRGASPVNTIWTLEAGGLRIVHLGDNRQLDELDLEAIGDVDVMMLNAAYFDAPSADMLALMLRTARPDVLLPMHYRHDQISELPRGMRPVGDYLHDRPAEFFEGNVIELSAGALPPESQIVVLKPSAAIEPWPEALHEAWVEANEGAGLLADSETEADAARAEEALWEGLFHYEAAMDLAPHVLAFGYGAADALARLGEVDDAIETLDHAVARAPRADWTDRARAHMLLAELYERAGSTEIAIEHYRYVVAQRHTHEAAMREQAIVRLNELR